MKFPFYLLVLLFLGLTSCNESKPAGVLDKQTYKQVMHDILLANVLKEELLSKENMQVNTMQVIYRQYNIDSVQLKKSIDYYSNDPQFLEDIYKEIRDKYQGMIDSMEKVNPRITPKKPKTDSIRVKKDLLKDIHKVVPIKSQK